MFYEYIKKGGGSLDPSDILGGGGPLDLSEKFGGGSLDLTG